jgi:hypothetical protein
MLSDFTLHFQFGKAVVCSDAAAEAARYGFTAVDRPEGYLVLAVASLGEEIKEVTGTPGAEVNLPSPSSHLEAATPVFISLPGGSWIGDCHFCDP